MKLANILRLATLLLIFTFAHTTGTRVAFAQTAGTSGADDLAIVQGGATQATIVVAPEAGKWEKQAATDLQKYIEIMTGAKPTVADTAEAGATALGGAAPVLIIGSAALKAEPSLQQALDKVKKKDPVVRADAMVVRRAGNRVYLAGSNDDSHYFPVSWLLQQWGCRWYLPTEFGECIPAHTALRIGTVDFAYAPPFELRHYWLSWNGSPVGAEEFRRRNYMTYESLVGMGHALGQYTKELAPEGGSVFNVPFAEQKTAEHVAAKIEADYAAGKNISLAIEDGSYETNSARDKELTAGIYDKYFMTTSMTGPMMEFYNNVAKILREKYPNSKAKLGGMAYVNVTIPPQFAIKPEPSVVMWLAPIDIDPIHGMDDPKSPPRQEYRDIMYRWAQIMEGRLAIYDYDQGMLVWRDIPNPSHMAFKQDVKHYQKAGILGIGTESRGAMATLFTNLYFRGQLMWNPDADVDKMLEEFYPKFYGPAAAPMNAYWSAIYNAWEKAIVTEHEYFSAPAIYTPQLMATLKTNLAAAEAIVKPLQTKANLSRDEKLYLQRMEFTRNSYDVIDSYISMVNAVAAEVDYKTAVTQGERGLAARAKLTAANPTFTTLPGEGGPGFWPGEVEQYRNLVKLIDGSKGTLIAKSPLEWALHRDPNDTGLASGWAYKPVDLTYWNANKGKYNLETRKDYPTTQWEMVRTDLYPHAQGLRHPDRQSYTGHLWYSTPLTLTADQAKGKTRLMFPGLFNEGWLYVNGYLIAHRPQRGMWWFNDYKFEWDVDLTGKFKPGKNTITLRLHNPHHYGGIFRRPFLYRPVAAAPTP